MAEWLGLDCSRHNGTLDWDKIKASGIQFAILRTGFGKFHPSQKDIQFERNYAEAKRVGMPIGAYHYSYAMSVEQAEMEADFVLDILKGKQFEYPIYFDIEEKTQEQLSMQLCGDMIKAFCTKLEKAGYWAGIYSYDSFFGTNVSDDIEKRYAVWVARLGSKPQKATVYQMWQYSWTGDVNGSSRETDMDICYVDYPTMIKKAGKNGYGKTPAKTYKVTGTKLNLVEKEAIELENKLKALGCTVTKAVL